jgi:imidazoleglycerol-phosphate dehydratase/histidinol-phosphatase
MKKILFIDRDGTILIEPTDKQIDSLDKMEFYPGVIVNLYRIVNETDFELVMVSNQDGLGTDSFPEETFWPVQNKMIKTLRNEGIEFSNIVIDKSFAHDNEPSRKPGTALLKKYMKGNYDLKNSFVIGDRKTDVELAKNLGAKSILLSNSVHIKADLATENWEEIYHYLCSPPRIVQVKRKTRETDIRVKVNLDGQGEAKIRSDLGFLKHMLELFANHSSFDITAQILGDLQTDEHHTVEDTAIVLGQALSKALGDKKGIDRYGFLLPMDESHAEVAIDFSGRSTLVWKVKFKRESVGEMPTEMFYHFFKSFCDSAKCNLYIKARGKNEHHKIEAIFKAVARACKMAVQSDPKNKRVPSSKGLL